MTFYLLVEYLCIGTRHIHKGKLVVTVKTLLVRNTQSVHSRPWPPHFPFYNHIYIYIYTHTIHTHFFLHWHKTLSRELNGRLQNPPIWTQLLRVPGWVAAASSATWGRHRKDCVCTFCFFMFCPRLFYTSARQILIKTHVYLFTFSRLCL